MVEHFRPPLGCPSRTPQWPSHGCMGWQGSGSLLPWEGLFVATFAIIQCSETVEKSALVCHPPPPLVASICTPLLEQFQVHLITLIFSHVKNNFSHFNDRKQPQNSNKNCTEKTALLSFKISPKLVQFNPNNSQLKINLWTLILHV